MQTNPAPATNDLHTERLEYLVRHFTSGKEWINSATFTLHLAPRPQWQGMDYYAFSDLQHAAIRQIEADARRIEAEAEATKAVERRTAAHQKLADARKRLLHKDTSIIVPAELMERLEAAIRAELPEDDLRAFNCDLTAHSGAITYRDIAFIAIMHRKNVLENGKTENAYRNTSPFNRIAKASKSTNYRETPFDNRQIRYGLTILEALDFTIQLKEAVKRSPGQPGISGTWALENNELWTKVFQGF